MRFCTSNMLERDNMLIKILMTQQSCNGAWKGNSCYWFFNKENKKRREKRMPPKELVKRISTRKKRGRCCCAFPLFQLVLIFFDIGFVSFTHASLLKFPLSYFLILFYQSFFRKLFSRAIKAFFMTQKYF